MSLFGNKEQYLGVDIGAHGIKVVELHKKKGRPQLWTYGIAEQALDIHPPVIHEKSAEELLKEQMKQSTSEILAAEKKSRKHKKKDEPLQLDDPRIDEYAGILKTLLKQAKTISKHATASLPVSHVFHTIVTLQDVDEKDISRRVRAEIKKLLPQPVEQMQIIHQVIPVSEADKKATLTRILVTAAPKSLVAFYTAIFERAGLQLKELETEAFALERSLVGRDLATVMVVDIGAERTNFFIMDASLPMTHQSIHLGGNSFDAIMENVLKVDHAMISQMKHDLAGLKGDVVDQAIFESILDPIVKEIQYGFELFLGQSGNQGKRPEKIVLTGGASMLPVIKHKIGTTFSLKSFVGDPWARVVYQQGLKPVLDEVGPRMAVSIGLALRHLV